MNITKQGDGLTGVLKMQITSSDYSEKVDNALKDYRKKAKIDGFRPGTIPLGMVKKMYGKHVLVDEVNKLISENLQKYIVDSKLQILGEPLSNETEQQEINWDTDTEFEFSFDIALAPEINVELSKKQKADYYKIVADTKMIDEHIENLTARFGSQETVNTIEGTELLRGTISKVGGEDSREGVSLLLSKFAVEAELDGFKKAKKGSKIAFNPMKAFENETEAATILGVNKDDKEAVAADCEFTISEILRFKKSEVNQSLFDKTFGEGVIADENEFRDRIKADFEARMSVNSDYKFFFDFKKKLLESHPIELPEAFLKRWLLETNKDNDKVTPEQIEQEFPLFLDDLRWQLISGKFIKDNNLKVTDDEIREGAREYTRAQFAQFGMFNPGEEDLNRWSQEILKNREEVNRIYESEIDKKLVAFFKETIKISEVETTLEDFNKMIENK